MNKKIIYITIVGLLVAFSVLIINLREPSKENAVISYSGQVDNKKVSIWNQAPLIIPNPSTEVQRKLIEVKFRYINGKKYPVNDSYSLMKNASAEDYGFMRAILSNPDKTYLWGHAIRALGFIGTDEAINDLLAMMPEDKTPYYYDWGCILHVLGFSAHNNSKAYDFLKQSCDFAIWNSRLINWNIPKGSNAQKEESVMRDIAIQSLAMSGKPEAKVFIYSIAQEENKKERKYRNSVGSIISAIAICDTINKYGYDKFKNEIYPLSLVKYREWKKDNNKWDKWYRNGELPPLEYNK